jgi:hypothetical protein
MLRFLSIYCIMSRCRLLRICNDRRICEDLKIRNSDIQEISNQIASLIDQIALNDKIKHKKSRLIKDHRKETNNMRIQLRDLQTEKDMIMRAIKNKTDDTTTYIDADYIQLIKDNRYLTDRLQMQYKKVYERDWSHIRDSRLCDLLDKIYKESSEYTKIVANHNTRIKNGENMPPLIHFGNLSMDDFILPDHASHDLTLCLYKEQIQ